jgi:hypothetical protein
MMSRKRLDAGPSPAGGKRGFRLARRIGKRRGRARLIGVERHTYRRIDELKSNTLFPGVKAKMGGKKHPIAGGGC